MPVGGRDEMRRVIVSLVSVAAAWLALTAVGRTQAPAVRSDVVLLNGAVLTVDPRWPASTDGI